MARRLRSIYSWSEGVLGRVGAVPEASLRAFEYDVGSRDQWITDSDGERDTVRLWRTRRPDLAPPELWVGDAELVEEVEA